MTSLDVREHLDRLRATDPELADELQKVVDRIEGIDPAEACRTWAEKAAARDKGEEKVR